jgi:hypothetical protein
MRADQVGPLILAIGSFLLGAFFFASVAYSLHTVKKGKIHTRSGWIYESDGFVFYLYALVIWAIGLPGGFIFMLVAINEVREFIRTLQ